MVFDFRLGFQFGFRLRFLFFRAISMMDRRMISSTSVLEVGRYDRRVGEENDHSNKLYVPGGNSVTTVFINILLVFFLKVR